MNRIYKILIGLLISTTVYGQQVDELKIEADSAYLLGNYAQAAEIYEQMLKQGESAEVYYNLGNAYYKSDEIAKAILNYERALLLTPNNSDLKSNLEIARAKTIDKEVQIPDIFFVAWVKTWIHSCPMYTWAIWGILTFWVMLLALCFYFFSKQILWKKIGFFTAAICLILTISCNLFAHSLKKELLIRNQAIVLSPSVTVRSTPSESGTSLFILHEGHKVEIKDNSMKEWKEIRLENDRVGWVPASSIEVI